MELSRLIDTDAARCPGLEQYAVKAFADALKVFPKILAENSGAPGQVRPTTFKAVLMYGDRPWDNSYSFLMLFLKSFFYKMTKSQSLKV